MEDDKTNEYAGQERRVDTARVMAHEDRFSRMKGDIKTLFKGHEASSVFIGQAKVIGIVCMCIFVFVMGANFIYTTLHINSASKMMGMMHQENIAESNKLFRVINETERDVDKLQQDTMLMTDRYSRLISDVGKVDSKVTQLVDMLQSHDTSKRTPYPPQYYNDNGYGHEVE